MDDKFKAYSDSHFNSIILETEEHPLFQLITSSILFESETVIHSQSSILNAFVSEVTFKNSTIRDITFSEIPVQIIVSQLTLEDMTITRLNNLQSVDFMLILLDSTLTISNLDYSLSNSILFNARTSSVQIDGISFVNVRDMTQLGAIADSYNISVNDITSLDAVITGSELLTISTSNNVSLSNIDIQNSEKLALRITKSTLSLMSGVSIRN